MSDARNFCICVALSLLTGCASLQSIALRPQHPPLLPPATLGSTQQAEQVLRAAFGDRELTLSTVVVANAQQLKLIGLAPMGPRVLTIVWDGVQVETDALPMPGAPKMDGELLIADLQLALWPLDALKSAYHAAGWELSEPGSGMRSLRRDGKLVAEVHYAGSDPWHGRLWLANFRYGYSLAITNEATEAAPVEKAQ